MKEFKDPMRHLKQFLSGLCLAFGFAAPVWAAGTIPSVDQVYQAAHAGNLGQAQAMMQQVLAAHPGSAKAHYVEARLWADQGAWHRAAAEFKQAQALAPGLPFLKPGEANQFSRVLSAHGAAPASAAASRNLVNRLWIGLAAIAVLAFVMLLWLKRRQARQVYVPSSAMPPQAPGAWPNAPYPGPNAPYPGQPAAGGGFGSALLTGLGVGAGIAAGEALADRLFQGNQNTSALPSDSSGFMPGQDLGGSDFGIQGDDSGGDSWDSGGGGDDGGGW